MGPSSIQAAEDCGFEVPIVPDAPRLKNLAQALVVWDSERRE
jgi:hypothetical protein